MANPMARWAYCHGLDCLPRRGRHGAWHASCFFSVCLYINNPLDELAARSSQIPLRSKFSVPSWPRQRTGDEAAAYKPKNMLLPLLQMRRKNKKRE
ncbi:hypothetical protein ACLKA6_002075 [Drosophila palustris]